MARSLLALLLTVVGTLTAAAAEPRKPNVVIVLADDKTSTVRFRRTGSKGRLLLLSLAHVIQLPNPILVQSGRQHESRPFPAAGR